jgi:membrane fusion protein (multidrug efflux system)
MTTIAFEHVAGTTRPKADLKRQLRRLALAGGVLGLATGAAWYAHDWWTVGRFVESTDDAYVGGNLTALAPHVDAFVDRVLVADNQRVRAGEVLIRLDPRDYRAAFDHAQAVLQARIATAASLRAQLALQQSRIQQQEADLVAKKAQAVFAAHDAHRYRVLAQSEYASRQNEERSTALDQESQSAVVAAQAGLAAARQQLKVLDAEIAAADAAVMQAQSDVETARLNLGYTEIKAPIDGYVGNRAAEVGAYATKGTYLISVTPATGLWVDANFKEDQLARMVPGEPATVTADVLPGHVFHGQVASLAPGTGAVYSIIPPENATGNFTKIVQRVPVRIVLDPGDPALAKLRPGLSTIVSVDTRKAGAAS